MTDWPQRVALLLSACPPEERPELCSAFQQVLPKHPLEIDWGISANVILSAISRSSDLTKRGVRGVIAEAIFETEILPQINGWEVKSFVGDLPYDFLLESEENAERSVRIQVKLQRMKDHRPMFALEGNRMYPKDAYTVEVQKTRGGIDKTTKEDTRPYRFGEFDLLAVNMQPSTNNWKKFMFTVSDWLVARMDQPALIEKFQPVPLRPNEFWTDQLETCIAWLLSGSTNKIFTRPLGEVPRASTYPKERKAKNTSSSPKKKFS